VPGLGRFLEVDPVQGGCANDYAYVYGDPVNASDIAGTATDCGKLWQQILDFVYRNKRKLGNKGTHGLIHRRAEMYRNGPKNGRAKFDTHRKAYEDQRRGLNRRLKTYDKDCKGPGGGPPTTSGARQRAEIDRWAARKAPTWADVTGSANQWHFNPPKLADTP
jgi:hypothetical protein